MSGRGRMGDFAAGVRQGGRSGDSGAEGRRGWRIPSVLQQAKLLLKERLREGSIVVDATVGNGHDTLFLAECVGETGKVYGFDIQKEALASAEARLSEAGLLSCVTLFHAGHERMADALPPEAKGRIQAVTFNLGYLPGGNKEVVTRPETTLQALQTSHDWLAPGGIITVVLYTGHPGGKEEENEVLQWARNLDQKHFQVLWYRFLNQRNHPPTLLAISRNQ